MVDLFVRTAALICFLVSFFGGSVNAVAAASSSARLPAADPELSFDLDQTKATVAKPAQPSASITTTYHPRKTNSNFSLIIPSVVVHGFPIDKEVADQMPRKMDGGQTVATPGVGLQYVSNGGFMVVSGIFKDCYDNLAGTLQLGQQFKLGSRTTFGYSAGIYARETPIACQTTMDRRGRKTTNCEEFDAYRLKFMTSINGELVDLIPMPFLHFTTAIYKDSNVEVDFKLMTNFALNEFGIAIPF